MPRYEDALLDVDDHLGLSHSESECLHGSDHRPLINAVYKLVCLLYKLERFNKSWKNQNVVVRDCIKINLIATYIKSMLKKEVV